MFIRFCHDEEITFSSRNVFRGFSGSGPRCVAKSMTCKQNVTSKFTMMPSFHQSRQSLELHYELQNGRIWPTVPWHCCVAQSVMRMLQVHAAHCRCIDATLSPESSSNQHCACELTLRRCAMATCMFIGAYHASPST